MPKLNRGTTTKLSIRLSGKARTKIDAAARNLGVSAAGAILFELSKLLKDPPSQRDLDAWKEELTLEKDHFVMSVNDKMSDRVNDLADKYGMRKNILIGYIVSQFFENANIPGVEEPKKLMVQVNLETYNKMMAFSEENYIPLSGIVSYSIIQGPIEEVPIFKNSKPIQFFTNVPGYIGDQVKDKAEEMNIREHLYVALCLYKQFSSGGRFHED